MRVYLSELFKKIAIRPLLIPAIIVCILAMGYCVFSIYSNTDLEEGYVNQNIKITEVTKKVNGKNSYIGIIDNSRVSVLLDEDYYPGDYMDATGIVKKIEKPTNPGEFDYSSYLKHKGINYQFEVEDISNATRSEFGRLITKFRYFLRDLIYDRFSSVVNEDDAALLAALCLGDSSLVDASITRDFRVTNCSHILAVSGSHFSAFILMLPYIFSIFNFDNKKSSVIYVFCILLIGFMTGWTESVTRAAIMSICSIFLRDSISGMSFAAIIMILSNPFTILSSGFQMSFCASISIIALNGKVRKIVRTYMKKKEISDSISVAICSQLGLMIFSFTNSSRIGIISFLTQIIGGFLIELVCVFFVLGLVFNLVVESSFVPSATIARLLTTSISFAAKFFDYSINLRKLGIIPLCLVLLGIVYLLKGTFIIKKCYRILSPLLITIILFSSIKIFMNQSKTKIIFIDVGQGDSCLILTERFTCLIDSGIDVNGIKTIPDVLDYYSIQTIDFAIMTHWDLDHGGGMIELLESGRVKEIYTSYLGLNKNVLQMLSNFYEEDEIPIKLDECFRELHYGQNIELDNNTRLEVIWPIDKATNGDNPDSLVMRLTSYDTSILFTGDIDFECEECLCDLGILDDTNILKVAHHGSKYSSGEKFLNSINPNNAVISVGEHNFYGHPSNETLERLEKVKANTFQTSKNGAIIVNIFTTHYEISTFKENKNAF